ncbi:hypothetical protein ZIOFF_074277 (mitochondrion) [Zingiber officinale]|uniref:Uncharacterized protein n=1 Tax=Zingiber officinale TaxID=94328 RepID=A0A8J5ET84_ZINOF|nr:hypothetical protein ZIOFF_074277 [Zingiber officinale]
MAARISKATLSSIVTGPTNIDAVKEVAGMIKVAFPSLQPLSLPWISRVPLHKGFSWVGMESSLRASCGFQGRPLDRQYRTRKANEDLGFYEEFVGPIFDELAISMDILFDQDGWLVPLRELVWTSRNWYEGVLHPLSYDANDELLTRDLSRFERFEHQLFKPYLEKFGHLPLRKENVELCLELERDGCSL